jgi:transcription-repair coupling factor (superfamily II helicase)
VLFEYGFDRVDYVTEPGQFSVRGGIVDVFSFSNDNPYRIEFLGNDVDSIRSFDSVTQLSIKKLPECIIIPNVQTKLLQESRQTFFEFIPENTVVWFKHFQFTTDKIEKAFVLAETSFNKLDTTITHLPPQELYIDKDSFAKQVLTFPLIEFSNNASLTHTKVIHYNFSPQPSFNKNFSYLNDNLKSNVRAHVTNIIFSDTAKQVERLNKLFEDINFNTEAVQFNSISLSIHEGFVDNDLKLACYTDHQIFDRYHRFHLKSSFNKKNEAITLKELKGLNPGDYITHIDYGIGRYGGLETIEIN